MALLLVAIFTPFIITVGLLLPPYLGITAAAYIIYDTGSAIHPLTGRLTDIFYMLEVYTKLFAYWQENKETVSTFGYTLPLLGLPLIGTFVGLWFTRKSMRKLRDIFYLSASA